MRRRRATSLRGAGRGGPLVKGENGVWERPPGLAPGVYQSSFGVHGVTVVDPANQSVNETTTGLRNLLVVPGGEWTDMKSIPRRGRRVAYPSSVLGRQRRLHAVYTPPGYNVAGDRYPVFYLCTGRVTRINPERDRRAGVILDNLIAANRASR
jgi:hypothetical protein